MFKRVLMLMAVALVFSPCEVQAAVIDSNWVGGESGFWNDVNNWDPTTIPDNDGNTFDVMINGGGNGAEVGLQQSRTINKLDCSGQVRLGAWTPDWVQLTLVGPSGLTNQGYLEIEEIEICGVVTNHGMLELGEVEIDGDLNNLAGAMLEIWREGGAEGDLENAGTIEIDPSSELWVDSNSLNTGLILVYDGEFGTEGTLSNDSNGVIKGFGVITSGELLDNEGEIIAYGGPLTVAISNGPLLNSGVLANYPLASLSIRPSMETQSVADMNNFGTIGVEAGGGVAFDCNLVNESDGTIELLGGTLAAQNITHSEGATFYGFGTIKTNELLIESGTNPALTGPTNIVGDVNIASGAALMIRDGQTLITGHTVNDGTILLVSGTVVFQGGYSGSGDVIDAAPSSGIIIDNGDEGTSSTGSWKISSVAGFYGENSLYSTTNGDSYSFEAWVVGNREISLWWTAHPGRSTAVAVKIYDGGDLLDTVIVNQRNNGGKWNVLGTYNFSDKAKVEILSAGSGATVADAVKFAPASDIIIDNGDEGTSSTGSWRVSSIAGSYGTNSLYSTDIGATYGFEARVLLTCKISLWWTAWPNRSDAVSVKIYNGTTLLDTVIVNQQINGGQWNVLGDYTFSDEAKVEIISGGGDPVVADAVKFTPL